MALIERDSNGYSRIVAFARQIGMVPIQRHRMRSDYAVSTILMPLMGASKGSFKPSTASSANARATILKPNPLLDELGEEPDQSFCHSSDSCYRNLGFLEA